MRSVLRFLPWRKRAAAKEMWRSMRNPCAHADMVYRTVPNPVALRRILEFGCSWGGNLAYFMDRHPDLEAVGIA